jgi:hypothetical protein
MKEWPSVPGTAAAAGHEHAVVSCKGADAHVRPAAARATTAVSSAASRAMAEAAELCGRTMDRGAVGAGCADSDLEYLSPGDRK